MLGFPVFSVLANIGKAANPIRAIPSPFFGVRKSDDMLISLLRRYNRFNANQLQRYNFCHVIQFKDKKMRNFSASQIFKFIYGFSVHFHLYFYEIIYTGGKSDTFSFFHLFRNRYLAIIPLFTNTFFSSVTLASTITPILYPSQPSEYPPRQSCLNYFFKFD